MTCHKRHGSAGYLRPCRTVRQARGGRIEPDDEGKRGGTGRQRQQPDVAHFDQAGDVRRRGGPEAVAPLLQRDPVVADQHRSAVDQGERQARFAAARLALDQQRTAADADAADIGKGDAHAAGRVSTRQAPLPCS